jgi:hypothetical protein
VSICAFTSLCEEDVGQWLDQYLREVESLDMPFAMHLDRCSKDTAAMVERHPLCIGVTKQDERRVEFDESHKQAVFDVVVRAGFDWAMAWDVDETWERDAPDRLAEVNRIDAHYVAVRWVNLWGDEEHVRLDGPFNRAWRVKFYRTRIGVGWRFIGKITNGPKATHREEHRLKLERVELTCLHWGMMTDELRRMHKARWDRIYTRAVGNNPYGFWNYALDDGVDMRIEEHDYV